MMRNLSLLFFTVLGATTPLFQSELRAESSGPVPGLGETTAAPPPRSDDPNLPGRVDRRRKKIAKDKWASTITGGDWLHFSFTGFWGVKGTDGSIMSSGIHWDPLLYESLDRAIGLRLMAGLLLMKRLDDGSPYPVFETAVLASNRISTRWRLEAGPSVQWWLTSGESIYPGLLLQLVLELDGGGVLDRIGFSFHPTLVKGVVAQLWRLSLGFQF